MYKTVGPEHLRDFERRRSLRFVLPCEETVTLTLGEQEYSGKLEDVSVGGAKLRLDAETLPEITDLRITHDSAGEIEGTCQWLAGNSIGVSFELSDPALKLISHCLRQGVPSGSFAA